AILIERVFSLISLMRPPCVAQTRPWYMLCRRMESVGLWTDLLEVSNGDDAKTVLGDRLHHPYLTVVSPCEGVPSSERRPGRRYRRLGRPRGGPGNGAQERPDGGAGDRGWRSGG